MVLIQALLVAGLALMQLVAGKLRFLDTIPRSRWLSMAGGIVAFPGCDLAYATRNFYLYSLMLYLIRHS